MTPAAKEFITPLTLSTLSGRPVLSEFFNSGSGAWNSHVELGLWADAMIVAPALLKYIDVWDKVVGELIGELLDFGLTTRSDSLLLVGQLLHTCSSCATCRLIGCYMHTLDMRESLDRGCCYRCRCYRCGHHLRGLRG